MPDMELKNNSDFRKVVELILRIKKVSVNAIRRHLNWGYSRSSRMFEIIKDLDIVVISDSNLYDPDRYEINWDKLKEIIVEYELDFNLDMEIVDEAIKLAKQKQKLQDINRIERKSFRESTRIENALTEYAGEIKNLLSKYDLSKFKLKDNTEINNDNYFGIIQLTDLHFNELIHSTEDVGNVYDFYVASKRLKKLAMKAIHYFKLFNIKNIFIACCGDFINSDRRLDELLNMAINRSKATLLSCYLLEQFIAELLEHFNIKISCVSGNESRVKEIHEMSDELITDNYDFMIYNILRIMFRENDNIEFLQANYKELPIDINGFTFLLTHGEILKDYKDFQFMVGKYAEKGKVINFILSGNFHSAYNSDFFARGSSLCGVNAYADKKLNLYGKASQNIHIVNLLDKNIDSIKVDLQNIDSIEDGYNIEEQLIAYNPKSANKIHDNKTILKIII